MSRIPRQEDDELKSARLAVSQGNLPRARALARRAAGHAIAQWAAIHPHPNQFGRDHLSRLSALAKEPRVGAHIREAAARLVVRTPAPGAEVAPGARTSLAPHSTDPVADGTLICAAMAALLEFTA